MKTEFYKMAYEDWDEGVECFGTGEDALMLEGAYLRLCHSMYRRRGPVSHDLGILARLWGVHVNKAKYLIEKLIHHKKVATLESGGHIINTRVTQELDQRGVLSTKRSDSGKTRRTPGGDSGANQLNLFKSTEAIASDDEKENPQRREEKEKENIDCAQGAKQKKAHSISENWIPTDQDREYAKGKQLTDSDISNNAEKFRDYHLKKGSEFAGARGWAAAWREWVRRAIEFGQVKIAQEVSTAQASIPLPVHGERVTDSMCPILGLKHHVGKIYISYDTDEWHAWKAYYFDQAKKTGTRGPDISTFFKSKNGGGWSFPDRWPLGHKKAKQGV